MELEADLNVLVSGLGKEQVKDDMSTFKRTKETLGDRPSFSHRRTSACFCQRAVAQGTERQAAALALPCDTGEGASLR